MAKITYEDKVFINENASIPEINKITDDNINEIKNVVNENDNNIGDLSNLNTESKNDLVSAINEINSSVLMAYLTDGFTINNTSRKIPLNNYYKIGNKLEFENNAIKIVGDDVSFIEVSVAVNGQASSTLNNVQLLAMVYKNNTQIVTGYDFKQVLNTYYFANAVIGKVLIPVVKNDVISLYTQVSENQTLQIVNEFKFGTAYLTVKTI